MDSHTETVLDRVRSIADRSIPKWRFKWGDFEGPEKPDYDDSDWETVDTEFKWYPPDSNAWYRTKITIPEKIGGMDCTGAMLWLKFKIDDDGIVLANGELLQQWHGASKPITISQSASPGDVFVITVKDINYAASGQLISAELHCERGEKVADASQEFLDVVDKMLDMVLVGDLNGKRAEAITHSLTRLDFSSLESGDETGFLDSLSSAGTHLTSTLESLVSISAKEQLALVKLRLRELGDLKGQLDAAGIDSAYTLATQTTTANFLIYADDDMATGEVNTVARGAAVVDYLLTSAGAALREGRRWLVNPESAPAVPRYTTGNVEIRNGAFYQGDRPLFFTGFGHFSQVRKDIPIFNDYGFNIVQITIGSPQVMPGPSQVNMEPIDDLVATLDRAAASNIAVNILIGPHFPKWVLEAHPDMRINHLGFVKFDVDHPVAREVWTQYLELLIPKIAAHPALFSIDLMNEPTYTDDGPRSRDSFKKWLENKHGSVNVINEQYGSQYGTINEIEIPDDDTEKPLWYDWCLFNQERFAEFHLWVRDKIKAMAPNVPMHVKVMGTAFDGARWFARGVDHEVFSKIDAISGNDNYSYDLLSTGSDYSQEWIRQAMFYDYQRSVAPDNPIFNSENHPIGDGYGNWTHSSHVRTVLWQGAIHGQGATTTWVWERNQAGDMAENVLTRPACVEGMGRAALDLLRLAPEIVALQQAHRRSTVAILCPNSSLSSDSAVDEMKAAYEGLYFLDTPIRFVTDRGVKSGELESVKMLIAPGCTFVDDATVEGVERFVERGGSLVRTGSSFRYSEYGRIRTKSRLSADPEGRMEKKENRLAMDG